MKGLVKAGLFLGWHFYCPIENIYGRNFCWNENLTSFVFMKPDRKLLVALGMRVSPVFKTVDNFSKSIVVMICIILGIAEVPDMKMQGV